MIREFFDHGKGLPNENGAGHFSEAGFRNVVIAFKAVPVHLSQNVTEGVVGQSEEKIVFSRHFPFEEKPDVGQGLTRNGQYLGVSDFDQIYSGFQMILIDR